MSFDIKVDVILIQETHYVGGKRFFDMIVLRMENLYIAFLTLKFSRGVSILFTIRKGLDIDVIFWTSTSQTVGMIILNMKPFTKTENYDPRVELSW